jgi:hypothetical protein
MGDHPTLGADKIQVQSDGVFSAIGDSVGTLSPGEKITQGYESDLVNWFGPEIIIDTLKDSDWEVPT